MSVSLNWKETKRSERREREQATSVQEWRAQALVERRARESEYQPWYDADAESARGGAASGAGERIEPTRRIVYVAGRGFVTIARCAMTGEWFDTATGGPVPKEAA